MATTQIEHESRLKAQAFDAIKGLEFEAPPQNILTQLKEVAVFKHSAYAAIALFKQTPTDTTDREAWLAGANFSEKLSLPETGRRFTPQNAEWMWNTNTQIPLNIGDLQSDERFGIFARESRARSLLAVAIKTDKMLGWLILIRTTSNAFTRRDVRFLQLLTSFIGKDIEHQNAHKNTRDQLARTRRLLDFDQQLMEAAHTEAVYQHITDMFLSVGADVCLLAEYQEAFAPNIPVKIVAARHVTPSLLTATTIENRTYSLADYPSLANVCETGSPLILDTFTHTELNANEAALLEQLQINSTVVLPVTNASGEKSLGYLLIGYMRPRSFSEAHISFFSMLTHQVGRAIDYHDQLNAMRQHARQLETGAEISRVTSQILDEDTLISQAVTRIKTGFDFYYVGIFSIDATGEWAVLRAGSGEEGKRQVAAGHKLAIKDETSMVGWAISKKQARIALDIGQDAVHFNNPHLPETRSEMALPLNSQNQTLGALTIQSAAVAAFSQEDVISLQIMADQLANAMLNARLYKNVAESSRKLNALLDINRDITATTNLQELLDTIITHAVSLAQADQGTIFLLNHDELVPQSAVGGYEAEMMAIRPKIGEGLSGTAAQTGTSAVKMFGAEGGDVPVPDTPVVPEVVAAVPIKTEARVIGVMLIRRLENIVLFSQSDIELLEGMALQAAIAWQNLSLLTSIEQNYRREQTIRELVARIYTASGVQNILQTTVTELTKALNSPGGAVRLAPKRQTQSLSPAKLKRKFINEQPSLPAENIDTRE